MQLRSLFVALALVATTTPLTVLRDQSPAQATEDASLTCFPHERSDGLRYDDTFGAGRSGGRRHKGTDIMSPKGLEVRAVADGVVETLGDGRTSGYYVRLVHGGGWESWYLHLDNDDPGTDNGRGGPATAYAEGLAEGSVVRAGDVIGYVGDSGNAEWAGSHTHFELHIDGIQVDPYPYLVEVEKREDALIALVTALDSTPAIELEQIHDANAVSSLSALDGSQCLPDSYQDIVEHLLGEPSGEGVLLTGVEAR